MIQGIEYTRHIPKSMLANRFKVTYSDISLFTVGETVYQIRQRGGYLLIGHTFHRSLDFDPETLECWSIDGSKLLAKVERLK
nr:MAG TPA: hypothetical protein [Caudoviricetes sp.]